MGIAAAEQAQQLYAGSLVTAEATAEIIRQRQPQLVTIVAMGLEGKERTDEDELCAFYIRNLLEGRKSEVKAVQSLILSGKESLKFCDPTLPHFQKNDLDIALQVNSYPFAIKVARENGILEASIQKVQQV